MPIHRKKPFSAKQKKEQLKSKRDKNRNAERDEFGNCVRHRNKGSREAPPSRSRSPSDDESSEAAGGSDICPQVNKVNQQPKTKTDKKFDPNRYRLHFASDSQEELDRRRLQSMKPFERIPEESLEVSLEDTYRPGTALDMPKRPSWNYKMPKHQLTGQEEKYFKGYLDKLVEVYQGEELSYFELNLETWRQLWRVLEMSEVILLITDIRHPALHFSPALYDYVTKELKKSLILVLNKIDLAPPSLVVAWTHYFQELFPMVKVICFTSFPKDQKEVATGDPGIVLHKKRRKGGYTAVGPKQLLKACESIVQGKVNLSSWREKIEGDIAGTGDSDAAPEVEREDEEVPDSSFHEHEEYRDGMLTIGCCGYPNVGKSSLMNGLVGKKVVSVSRTPGHTKHFQTIFLTPTVRLCDSPGLVFPSLVPKSMQVLSGIYPVAQVREPFSVVGYLAQRIPVPALLRIHHPSRKPGVTEQDLEWSAFDICDAWADKRGFVTAKAARQDTYRAANSILRLAMEGRLCLCSRPPGYTKRKDFWESHPDTVEIIQQQEMHRKAMHFSDEEDEAISDIDEEEDEEQAGPQDSETAAEGKDGDDRKVALATNNPFALLSDDQ